MAGELELAQDHMEYVNSIAVDYLQGKSATDIARERGLTRVKVMDAISDWRQMAANNVAIRERARDALAGADLHFTELIRRSYEVIDQADLQGNLKEKSGAIRLVKDLEAQRIEMLQRAGVLDNRELADQLAEMEKKYEAMKHILNNVLCPECKLKVLKELRALTQESVVIDVG